MSNLIQNLKDNGQDFEFYPTTPSMIQCIAEHYLRKHPDEYDRRNTSILDIGAGTCNFKKYMEKFTGDKFTYSVIEKSKILIDALPSDVFCVGTDFHQVTLIDKAVDVIFCNPPYSEYVRWVCKIIKENNAQEIYLVIPQRWKDNADIQDALKLVTPCNVSRFRNEENAGYSVIGSFDFLDAERSARAKVDIVYIHSGSKRQDGRTGAFNRFFDEMFHMADPDMKDTKKKWKDVSSEEIKREISTGKNKIDILCNGYEKAQHDLFESFTKLCSIDPEILSLVDVKKENVKKVLWDRFIGLKYIYWEEVLNCLSEITDRLSRKTRNKFMDSFTELRTVDFNHANIYSLLVWVCKNATQYYKEQMIDFFFDMTSPENIRNYKSNKKVIQKMKYRYNSEAFNHYTLDYRIICTRHMLPNDGTTTTYYGYETMKDIYFGKINDVCVIARNLGFNLGDIEFPEDHGNKGYVKYTDGRVFMEFKIYKNDNVHIKFDKEFMKALNVEVARELGWIKAASDITEEFDTEMKGAEKYFNCFKTVEANVVRLLN